MSQIQQALQQFVVSVLNLEPHHCELKPLQGDAGFRQYFRVYAFGGKTYIAAFAPPETEKNMEFISIANGLRQAGISVPEVLAFDINEGFLLQQDLGDDILLPNLNDQSADKYYQQCMKQIQKMQWVNTKSLRLPNYDAELLLQELEYFQQWFVEKLLGYEMSREEKALCDNCFAWLIEQALRQPQAFVHRDYHSRNILLVDGKPAVIDFQDAVQGPFTYDLVSLLRDCYIVWPQEKVSQWLDHFYQQYVAPMSASNAVSFEQFTLWFDAMGLQRHIKVLGIFARLSLRDNKHRYLDDLPVVLNYVLDVAKCYPESEAFYQFISERLLPICKQKEWGESL